MSFSIIGLLIGLGVAAIVWYIGAWFIAKIAPAPGGFPLPAILQIVLAIVCVLIIWMGATGGIAVHL